MQGRCGLCGDGDYMVQPWVVARSLLYLWWVFQNQGGVTACSREVVQQHTSDTIQWSWPGHNAFRNVSLARLQVWDL